MVLFLLIMAFAFIIGAIIAIISVVLVKMSLPAMDQKEFNSITDKLSVGWIIITFFVLTGIQIIWKVW